MRNTHILITRQGEGDVWIFSGDMDIKHHPLNQMGDIVAKKWDDILNNWSVFDLPTLINITKDEQIKKEFLPRLNRVLSLRPMRIYKNEYEAAAKAIWSGLLNIARPIPNDCAVISVIARNDKKISDRIYSNATEKKMSKKKIKDSPESETPSKKKKSYVRAPKQTLIGFPLSWVITSIADNPKRGKAAERYAIYKTDMTIEDALAAGALRKDLWWDIKKGFLIVSEQNN